MMSSAHSKLLTAFIITMLFLVIVMVGRVIYDNFYIYGGV